MSLIVLDQGAVRARLSFDLCIPAIRAAMIDLSAGATRQTLRQIVAVGGDNKFGVMQGALAPGAPFGLKAVSVFPGSVAAGGKSHQGVVVLFDPDSGAPTCILDAGELTGIRTAAASAVATDALARADADSLAVLGAGEQAGRHVEAIAAVRTLRDVTIWGRSIGRADALAQDLQARLGLPVRAACSVEEAVAGAAIICTTTSAAEPILHSAQVADGAHINAVGSSHAGPSEIDVALVARARVFADHREAVLAQGAEFLRAKAAGLVDDDHVLGEIGQVLSGDLPGRTAASQVTLYKSLGNIVQDLASAALLQQIARAQGGLPVIELQS